MVSSLPIDRITECLHKAIDDEELKEAIIEWLRATAEAERSLARWRDRRGKEDPG